MKKLLAFLTLIALPLGATELSDRVQIPEFRRDTGKPIYLASLAPLASMPALFQIIPSGGGGGAATGTILTGGTASRFVVTDSSGLIQTPSSLVANTGGAGNGVLTFLDTPTGGSATSNFFNITGTLPTTLTADTNAVYFPITTAGSSNQILRGFYIELKAGYTGANRAVAMEFLNSVNGTGANLFTGVGNFGIRGVVNSAAAGHNFGIEGSAISGAMNIGVVGRAVDATNSVGVAGFATAGSTARVGGYFGFNTSNPTYPIAALVADNFSVAAPIAIFRDNGASVSTAAAWAGTQILDGGQPQNGPGVLTSSTATVTNAGEMRSVISRYDITNAMVTALGAVGAGDVQIATLPAKTIVKNAYIVIDSPDSSANALTIAFGRVSATYIDYIVASDAKGAANTVYGDASGERGTNLTGYDLPSYTATTNVFCHFIKTTTNLSTVTGFTAHVIVETTLAP